MSLKLLPENTILLSIAIILPFFTSKVYNVYNNKVTFECSYDGSDKSNLCREKEKAYNKIYNNKKLTAMIIISSIFIIGGFMIGKSTSNMSLAGISIGGFLLLLWNLIRNWSLFDEQKQVMILGGFLLVLLYVGLQISK